MYGIRPLGCGERVLKGTRIKKGLWFCARLRLGWNQKKSVANIDPLFILKTSFKIRKILLGITVLGNKDSGEVVNLVGHSVLQILGYGSGSVFLPQEVGVVRWLVRPAILRSSVCSGIDKDPAFKVTGPQRMESLGFALLGNPFPCRWTVFFLPPNLESSLAKLICRPI